MNHSRFIMGQQVQALSNLSLEEVDSICSFAKEAQANLRDYPLEKVWELFYLLQKKWADKTYPMRLEAKKSLPELTGFSAEMIDLGLDFIGKLLDPEALQRKLSLELREIPRLGPPKYNLETKTMLKWYPLGTVLHVLSGNVFLVGISSFIEGLLTGNATLLKMSSDEVFFMPLFMKSVQECEKELGQRPVVSNSISIIDYRSSETQIIKALKESVDGIVVWGGENAVRAYREDLPSRVRFISFGPKLSFGLATAQGLETEGLQEIANLLAFEVSIWDQNACTAPQVFFVEGEERAKELTGLMPGALEKIARSLPPGDLDPDSAAEIRKLRSVAEIAAFHSESFYLGDEARCSYTVFYEPQGILKTSPLNRTISIIPYQDLSEVIDQVESLKSYVQTIGLACGPDEFFPIAEMLAQRGALKVCPLGTMSGGEIDDPHDGAYDFPQLLNLVSLRMKDISSPSPRHYSSHEPFLLQKLNSLFARAKESPYYKKLSLPFLESLRDLSHVPILTKEALRNHAFPGSLDLATSSHIHGGQVTRSGGTTGEANFSWFDQNDWDQMVAAALVAYKHSGITKEDRVANCFMAGDLYGSFISFNDVNLKYGVTSYSFAGAVTPENFVSLWKKFHFTTLQGVPGSFMPWLRKAKDLCPEMTIKKIMYAGEPLISSERRWLKEFLGVELIISFIGTTESGLIAYQNEDCEESEYHLLDEYNFLEVVDDSGTPLPLGEKGRVLVTNLKKFAFPVIRYDIGDQGQIVVKTNSKGERVKRLLYSGRHGDIICVGAMNIDFSDLEVALKALPVSALQLVVKDEGEIKLQLKLESSSPGKDLDALVRLNLEQNLKLFKSKVANLNFEISSLEIGSIERNKTTGKIKKIIDLR